MGATGGAGGSMPSVGISGGTGAGGSPGSVGMGGTGGAGCPGEGAGGTGVEPNCAKAAVLSSDAAAIDNRVVFIMASSQVSRLCRGNAEDGEWFR